MDYWWCLFMLLHWPFVQGEVYSGYLQTLVWSSLKVNGDGNCQDAPAAAVTPIPRSWRRWTRSTAALARRLNAHSEGALLGKAVLGFGIPPVPRSCAHAIPEKSAEGSPLTPALCSLRTISCCPAGAAFLHRPGEGSKWLLNDSTTDTSTDGWHRNSRSCGVWPAALAIPRLAQCLYLLRPPRFPLSTPAVLAGCVYSWGVMSDQETQALHLSLALTEGTEIVA